MTKKVFISLPMRNRTLDEIRADMNDIFKTIKSARFDDNEDVEMINTLWLDEPTDDIMNDSIWYLGRSIKALAEANVAVFHSRWRESWGCIIEHMVCAMYNIPYYDISY